MKLKLRAFRPGVFRAKQPRVLSRPVLVEVGLTLPAGYLEKHCRYARLKDPAQAPTFLNTVYAEHPPGVRVGPWPGWRGIPELPTLQIRTGGRTASGKYYFLGDEEVTGELRVMFACETGLGRVIEFVSSDAALKPVRAQVLDNLPALAPPQPVALRTDLRGVHPRLVVETRQVETLRQAIRGSRAPHWRRLRQLVRGSWELPYATTPEGKVLPGRERLTGADRALIAACTALLQPDAKSATWAKKAYFAYLRETARPDFGPLGIDTQSGEVLYILCVGYDWLYNVMTARERARARQRLWEVAAICRRHLDPARRDYAQAHYLGCGLGMLAFAFLFWDEHPEAFAWVAELRGALGRVLAMLPADGFFPHGLNLWIYEHGFLLRWLELFRQCTGEDLWRTTPYFAGASRFRAAATSPDEKFGVTFGDPQYRVTGDSWCHLLIARRTGEPVAQALGEALLNQPPTDTDHRHAPPRRRVYELLWHAVDERVALVGDRSSEIGDGTPGSYERERVVRRRGRRVAHSLTLVATGYEAGKWSQAEDDHRNSVQSKGRGPVVEDGVETFADGGQVFVRRGATLVTLRSGAPLGRQRRAAGEVGGYGHSDPCNGAILVWRGGTFVGSGPGPLYRRDTALHNLVTIGGRGQIGDSCVWFPDFIEEAFIPSVPMVTWRGSNVQIRCELAAAYLPHLGVRRHTRTIQVGSDGALTGEDVVELSSPDVITWHWHTWAKVTVRGPAFELHGPDCRARLVVAPEAGTQMRLQPECFVAAYPHEGTVGTEITVTRRSRRTVFHWRLEWM
jgi:hypothetical protein